MTLPTYFISHGGGPWPWIPPMREFFAPLEKALKQMVNDLEEKPRAILMISAHWEENEVAIMGAEKPSMIYDYFGFPPHTYSITYPAKGAPDIAQRTLSLLETAGIKANINPTRGYDHGLYAPMEVMYPEADMPIFQVSLLKSYDPEAHFAIGRALAPLRDEGILIVGSGLSFHNIPLPRGEGRIPSAHFDAWLYDTMNLAPEDRSKAMTKWETAPYARICHEQEDHLMPIFVALGAAETEPATRIYNHTSEMTGITVSNYKFG